MQLTKNTILYEVFHCSMFMYCSVYRPHSYFFTQSWCCECRKSKASTEVLESWQRRFSSTLPTHASKGACGLRRLYSVCLSVCLSALSLSTSPAAGAWQDALQLPGTGCVWLPHCKCRLHLITMPIPFTPRALHCPTCRCRCQGSCTVIRHWPPRNRQHELH